eukprot:7105450-Alexandrium_andersonii.AAC.1
MSASLVGSEMCIRDRVATHLGLADSKLPAPAFARGAVSRACSGRMFAPCLLYTSDAADDM